MTRDLAIAMLDGAGLVCALLMGARVFAFNPRSRNGQLVALLCLCTAAYTLLARDDYRAWIAPAFQTPVGPFRPALNILRNLTPGLFMLLAHGLFTDRRRLPLWLIVAFAVEILLEEPVRWLGWPVPHAIGQTVPTLLQTLFCGCAIYWTCADWPADLVETRRRARAVVMVILAMNVTAPSLLLRVLIPFDVPANYNAHVALSVWFLLTAIFLLVRLTDADLIESFGRRVTPTPRAATEPGPDQAADLARLVALVEDSKLYREPGLTLKGLADRAGLPEYKARRLIHEGLGHRNFNAFLHAYRIRDACAQLADPNQRRTPILTIALDVGYQSLNTFNRGFREVMGVTPSTYRAEALGQNQQSDPISWNRPGLAEIGKP